MKITEHIQFVYCQILSGDKSLTALLQEINNLPFVGTKEVATIASNYKFNITIELLVKFAEYEK